MVVGQFAQEAELAVVGGGAGGYHAALRAAELGVQTILVDPHGACPHLTWLALRTSTDMARVIRDLERAAKCGLEAGAPRLDVAALRQWTRQLGEALTTQLEQRCVARGVEIIRGTATFESDREIAVRDGPGARLRFKRAVIASGSRPVPPPGDWPESDRVTPAWGVLALERVPKTLLVVGGGETALELAGIWSALGSRVSLVTAAERILPEADPDLLRPLERRLGRQLDELAAATAVTGLREAGDGVAVTLESRGGGDTRTYDHVAVALGAEPNTACLGLDKLRVETGDDGRILVDEQLRTSNPRILAVGDVTGAPMVANRAIHQGRVAAEVVAGRDAAYEPQAVVRVVFSDPPVAWCGLTEAEAKAAGVGCEVRRADWSASGRAASLSQTEGVTKLIVDAASKVVLGVGITGAGAPEMIGEGALAVEMGAVLDDLAAVVHAHPTLSELLGAAAQQAAQSLGA